MSRIVRAKVESNSSDDSMARVKISCEGLWEETPLIESVGGIPLKKGDYVFVDASVIENPLIIGRAMSKNASYGKSVNGSLLFESSNGSQWTIGMVKNNKLEIVNSDGATIVIDGKNIELNGMGVTIKVPGTCTPSNVPGPFCAIPNCPYTGAPHTSQEINVIK